MIAHLTGTLFAKNASTVILDVGGVGYEVTIPLSTFYDLEDVGTSVALRIYTYVREDSLQLYGFKTNRERDLFMRLISVSGVGPKLGITMLSGMSADEIISSLRTNNLARLTSIPGIGRKTAERLVIELRDKVAALTLPDVDERTQEKPGAEPSGDVEAIREDALSALLNLEYPKAAAERAVMVAIRDGDELTVEAVLRRALRQLAKG